MIPPLEYRILELSKRHKLGHLSSNLTAIGIIDEIYTKKRAQDLFVLSAGHAGLALYVALEKHEGRDANALYLKHRTHPYRDPSNGIHVSAGSLGCAITVALGMAMADRSRDVYCLISDGESFEGSVSEVRNLADKFDLANLKVYVNVNGYSCIEKVGHAALWDEDSRWHVAPRYTHDAYQRYPFLRGVQAHYHNLTDEDWAWVEANR